VAVLFLIEQNKLVEPLYQMDKEGKLSGEGYAKYVEDLKRQRSQIEASKASREFYGTKSS